MSLITTMLSHEAASGAVVEPSLEHLKEGIANSAIAHATVLIAAFFIFLSISFELVRDGLRKTVPPLFQPILHALYSELTNMGLAGIVMYLCGNVGDEPIFEQLSVWLLSDPELLKEQAEHVHMLIFLFMLLLVVFVLGSLLYVFGLSKLWEMMEKAARANGNKSISLSLKEIDYANLRARFIATCDGADDDFAFFQYRKVCVMEDFCELVDLHPSDWIMTAFVLMIVWGAMTFSGSWGYFVFVLFLWSLCGYSLWQYHSLHKIRLLLHPPKSRAGSSYGTFQAAAPSYTAMISPPLRSWLALQLLGPVGDKHRALFWPGARGPALLRHTLRVRFLLVSITLAVMITFYAQFLWHTNMILVIFSALPLGAALVLLPVTTALLADVTSIEGMKRENVVSHVTHQQRLDRSVAILKSLVSLSRLADLKIGSVTPRSIRPRNKKEEEFLRTLREMFDSFDTENSGSINREQFRELMHYFQPKMSAGEADGLFDEISATSDNGQVFFHELAAVMLANFAKLSGETKQSTRELAHNLWRLFDPEDKGSIVIGDVIQTLSHTSGNLDMPNIEAFFSEADSDHSGTLEKAEFIAFVHKHVL